ncbi:hypothetical protein J6590_022469 [Homalodisca vitripennis]|nr:hypothetical protein J6590_022469 [Homalodisca vitripennis]
MLDIKQRRSKINKKVRVRACQEPSDDDDDDDGDDEKHFTMRDLVASVTHTSLIHVISNSGSELSLQVNCVGRVLTN